ncbi:RDD family protein [Nocardia takedensis]
MTYEAAPFFRRLAARVLDLLFCLVLTFVIAIPVGVLMVPISLVTSDAAEDALFGLAAALCYFAAYVGLEVFLLVRREGQTLSKGLLGLRVIAAGEWARPRVSPRAATLRMLIIFLPFVLMSLAGNFPESSILEAMALVGLLSLFASIVLAAVPAAGRRAVHDLAASSRVVRAQARPVHWRTDIPLVLPERVSLRKRL